MVLSQLNHFSLKIYKASNSLLQNLSHWLNNYYYTERYRWVHWFPVGLIFGIAFYFNLPYEPGLFAYLIAALTAIVAIVIARKKQHLLFFCYLIFGFCIGFCLIGAKINDNKTVMFNDSKKAAFVTGTIESIENHPYKVDATFRLILDHVVIDSNVYESKIRLNAPAESTKNWDIGDQISAKVSIYTIPMPISLHGYFARRAAFLQEIGGTARLLELTQHIPAPESYFSKYRHKLTQILLEKLQKPYGAVAAALVTGDRSYIPKELRQHFADAGLAHVLAISGLHLSLIAGLIFLLLRRLLCLLPIVSNHYPTKKIAAVLAAIASGFYMAVANFGIPVQRSFIMICLAMLAICLDRTALSMRSIAVAAIVVLIIAPQSILSASFQLSFAAVLGLLAFYESAWPKLQEKFMNNSGNLLGLKKLIWGVFGILMTTIIASLATTPYSIAFFQRFTAQAILGNLIAIPLVSLMIMPLALFNVIFLLFGGSNILFWLWEKSLAALCKVAVLVAQLPGAAIHVKAVPEYALATFSFGMLWLCIWKKSWRWFGVVPILLGILLWRTYDLPIAYISNQCDVMVYYENDIVYVSDTKRNTFACDIWTQEWGTVKQKPWPNKYLNFPDIHLMLIESPKDGIEYLKQNSITPQTIITFGYAKTLKKYGISANKIIDRTIIQHGGGVAVFKKPPYLCLLNNFFGNRPWC